MSTTLAHESTATSDQPIDADKVDQVYALYYNEACSLCGIPACLHKCPDDLPSDSLHSTWGDVDTCRTFVRCNPPKPAYSEPYMEYLFKDYYKSIGVVVTRGRTGEPDSLTAVGP